MAFPQTFRAYQYENYGPLDRELKLQSNVPQKKLGAEQVRIRVHSASVNPIDYMLLEAVGQLFLGKTPSATEPFGIGFDAAGEIVEVGKDVKRLKVGDEVYAMTPFSAFGTLGEFSVVDEQFVATKPRNLSFDEAASAPLVALTAYQGMFEHAKLQKGETVLILGEFVKSLGAHQAIDYQKEKWLDEVEAHSVDAFYNCGVENAAWNEGAQVMLKQNTITILPMAQPIKEAEFGAHLIGEVHVHPSAGNLASITKYIEAKEVKPVIDTESWW
ncbi:Alcohol dehydrogenase GroES-like domain [Phytophthora infestans]|uniref:Alcohol dehydrogenase GroES-like domain n=1 Tax=Phytophthora infestans TaxID=4787 RepID=A0A8S9U3Y9_PHYIN|nr:Alcohol dehydrogenase GroES-like domain [Phytophthora infestans]